jgi:hypothetical protein
MIDFAAWACATLLVLLTVSIHYEVMSTVSDRIVPWAQRHFHGRRMIAIAVAALMAGHIAEVWVWALAYIASLNAHGFGALTGDFDGGFNSFLYFSAVCYTSLGDNGIRPEGAVRALAAAETLTGMMMIGWSASFTYLKMEQIWKRPRGE